MIIKCANCRGDQLANSNWYTQRHKVEINAYKHKVQGEYKSKILKPNDKYNLDPNISSPDREACLSLEINSALEEIGPSLEEVTSNPKIKIHLVSEWVKYKEEYSYDQDELPEQINHSKIF